MKKELVICDWCGDEIVGEQRRFEKGDYKLIVHTNINKEIDICNLCIIDVVNGRNPPKNRPKEYPVRQAQRIEPI